MFALISPLISLFAGGLPRLLDIWQSSKDQKHEVTMAQLQIQAQLEAHKAGFKSQERIEEIRLDEIKVQAEQAETESLYKHDAMLMEKASSWVSTLSASVRPIVTYIFVLELVSVNVISYWMAWASGLINDYATFKAISDEVFSAEEMVMLMDIIMFWFGARAFNRKS